jgi:hypothetical protein
MRNIFLMLNIVFMLIKISLWRLVENELEFQLPEVGMNKICGGQILR